MLDPKIFDLYRAVETASTQTLTRRERVEDRAVETALFSSFRGGPIRLCKPGFNRRLLYIHLMSSMRAFKPLVVRICSNSSAFSRSRKAPA